MYFSMHIDMQASSFFDNDVPGEGMHLSKQSSFIFCYNLNQYSEVYRIYNTSISRRAWSMAASCRICSITASLGVAETGELLMNDMIAERVLD